MAAPLIFDNAKGRWVEKYLLPVGGDNIIVLLLKASGLQADASLKAHATMAALLSANSEADFTNYGRKVLSVVDISVSLSSGTWTVDIADQIWSAAGGAVNNGIGCLVTAYRKASSDTTAQWLPLTAHPFAVTTNGTDLKATVPSIGTQP